MRADWDTVERGDELFHTRKEREKKRPKLLRMAVGKKGKARKRSFLHFTLLVCLFFFFPKRYGSIRNSKEKKKKKHFCRRNKLSQATKRDERMNVNTTCTWKNQKRKKQYTLSISFPRHKKLYNDKVSLCSLLAEQIRWVDDSVFIETRGEKSLVQK